MRGGGFEYIDFTIFNLWGEKLFETKDASIGWNGMYKGKEVNSGTYVYTLTGSFRNDNSIFSKGTLTIIR